MIVVDKRVHRVMHMTVIGALQIRNAHQIEVIVFVSGA